jgi:hypothetical protein
LLRLQSGCGCGFYSIFLSMDCSCSNPNSRNSVGVFGWLQADTVAAGYKPTRRHESMRVGTAAASCSFFVMLRTRVPTRAMLKSSFFLPTEQEAAHF